MHELSKATRRRFQDHRFERRWFVGDAIDIGGGNDSLVSVAKFYPQLLSVRNWDIADGDAQYMAGVPDNTYEVVHSSHCLEHTENPYIALQNWIRICKPKGHLIIMVPDEDLYEQGVWPSEFNKDHKKTFTIMKKTSWSPVTVNIFSLLADLCDQIKVLKVELLDSFFIYELQRLDQTSGLSESGIEIVLEKL